MSSVVCCPHVTYLLTSVCQGCGGHAVCACVCNVCAVPRLLALSLDVSNVSLDVFTQGLLCFWHVRVYSNMSGRDGILLCGVLCLSALEE